MATDGLIMPLDLARFVAAYVLIVALPGYALSTMLRPSAPRLERLAFAVPCACSVVAVYGLATALLHIPLTLVGYVAICAAIVLLGVAATRRRTARRARQTQGTLPLGLAATAGRPRTEAPPPAVDRWWVAPAAVALLEGIVALVIHAGDVVPAAPFALPYFAAYLILTVALSLLSLHLVETPARRAIRQAFRGHSRAQPSVAEQVA